MTSRWCAQLIGILQDVIGEIDVILVSNSYWIGEDIPCLTFGLRGVIHATLGVSLSSLDKSHSLTLRNQITSDQPDLHSGMQGGGVSEPLVDMVRLLASLNDANGRVQIPKFLEDVRVLGSEESKLIDAIIERCDKSVSPLSARRVGADAILFRREQSEKLRKHSHIADIRSSLLSRCVRFWLLVSNRR